MLIRGLYLVLRNQVGNLLIIMDQYSNFSNIINQAISLNRFSVKVPHNSKNLELIKCLEIPKSKNVVSIVLRNYLQRYCYSLVI